ncbi:MAG: tRNA (N(6)-L-threonylcarbamoyladenosine(37)-C(2))-methylthiotransferase MtaB [Candidatus Fimenecus sp.]
MKVKLYTLGCKVNQYETEEITEQLLKNGYEITLQDGEADIFVVNSCTVTAESDRKTRQLVRRLKRNFPESTVVLTGCMPQAFPDAASALSAADIVIGNKNNVTLPQKLHAYFETNQRLFAVEQHKSGEPFLGAPITDFHERTRAILKIEDGCDRFCSYCIIPTARGRVRSKPIAEIEKEAQALSDAGYRELVLVGINLSAYGKDSGERFTDAVAAACAPSGVLRVRLGSLEPDHITDEVIEALSKLPKLCGQFHISLQSGCDRTLQRMNRHYTAAQYAALAQKLRAAFPDCTLTTDIMVGFAGETEEDFQETVAFAKQIGFEKIHVFPYSVREGTRAASFDGQIEKCEKDRRAAELLAVAAEIRRAFLQNQIGKTVEVLCEHKTENGLHFGYTANYTPVYFESKTAVPGSLCRVTLEKSDGESVYGV